MHKINRFEAMVNLDGKLEHVHIPSTGRLDGVLVEGNPCYLKPSQNPKRKTAYSLFLVESNHTLVCIDALMANQFTYELLKEHQIPDMKKGNILREVSLGNDRLDFVIQSEEGFDYIEVKSVNKSDGNLACFPDAPTERGRKHVQHLIEHQKQETIQSHIVFIVQRNDASLFTACQDRDPEFAALLQQAIKDGVKVHAALTKISKDEISFDRWLSISL